MMGRALLLGAVLGLLGGCATRHAIEPVGYEDTAAGEAAAGAGGIRIFCAFLKSCAPVVKLSVPGGTNG